MNKVLCFGLLGLFLVSCVAYNYSYHSIPQIIPDDYNCEEHPGIIGDSNPALFESGQHYINRHSKSVKNQIEEACD